MTATRATSAASRESRVEVFDLEAPPTGRRSRVPELALGLLLIVGGALAALVWQLNISRTVGVLAVVGEIEQGQVVELDDLQILEIRWEGQANVLDRNQAEVVVGKVAKTDLKEGTILTPEHVVAGIDVAPGQAVVGLSLESRQYPSRRLRPDDLVNVIVIDPDAAELSLDVDDASGQAVVEGAVVREVQVSDQGTLFVSVVVSEAEAAYIAQAGSLDRIALVQVPRQDDG